MPIPVLTTPRLTLRGFRAADWDAYAALSADPVVRKFLGGKLLSREEAWTQMALFLGEWALRGYGIFAVDLNGQFAGRVGIMHPADWPEPELAWSLTPRFWGAGLATEAALQVRDWAFATFGWSRLVSFINPENVRSKRVAERLGAVQDGTAVLHDVAVERWVHPAPGHGVVV